ncbi:putative pancreatic alpha-amylase-like [Triplophysa rosa]|uniref:alpha-amylase n=1 Tax=Triplophysa rosa TaxID=992332 RepID=A0A9W7WLF6_TRIRA|nr:putative pancreatic alpha-amylase-like [Triplophysa rosa]
MAKWGEGDPRWIVEERADATNVNNWHWTERDATNWSSEKLKELLMGLRVESDDGMCEITEFSKVEGEASINNRKGKLIFFYEWNLKATWTGTSKSGIKYKGNIEVPNLSDENDMDDLDISVSLCKDEPETTLLSLMRREGADKVRLTLASYVDFLKTEFTQGMILPTANGVTKQQNAQAPVKSNKTQISSSTAAAPPPSTGVKIPTCKFSLKDTFLTSPDELYRVFLNQEYCKSNELQLQARSAANLDAAQPIFMVGGSSYRSSVNAWAGYFFRLAMGVLFQKNCPIRDKEKNFPKPIQKCIEHRNSMSVILNWWTAGRIWTFASFHPDDRGEVCVPVVNPGERDQWLRPKTFLGHLYMVRLPLVENEDGVGGARLKSVICNQVTEASNDPSFNPTEDWPLLSTEQSQQVRSLLTRFGAVFTREQLELAAANRARNCLESVPALPIGTLVLCKNHFPGRHKIQDVWGTRVHEIVECVDDVGTLYKVKLCNEGGSVKIVHRLELRVLPGGFIPSDTGRAEQRDCPLIEPQADVSQRLPLTDESSMKLLVVAALFGLCFAQHDPNTKHGRTSIVHLFEWRWADIAAECERYLAPNGYAAVQISPPSESIVVTNPWHPWWQRYQPISYNLCSRSGTEGELRDMIIRCNNVGVNIYVDAVINHMCGAAGGEGNHSSCGTYFNSKNKDFPSVPYSSWDFNDYKCKTGNGEVESYNDIFQVRDCRLVIDLGGEAIKASEYFELGRVTEFKYSAKLGKVIREWDGEKLSYLKSWGEGWGFMPSDKAVVFLDNHDNQRGHGAGGASVLTFWDSRLYKIGTGFMLAHPYGVTRVMSSFRWDRHFVNAKDENDWMGPPSNADGSTKPIPINPDTTCGDNWWTSEKVTF